MKAVIVLLAVLLAGTLPCLGQPDSLWMHTYGGSDAEWAYSVLEAADGGYVLGGHTNSYGAGGSDLWMVKTEATGDTQWCQTFGGVQDEYAGNTGRTADGGYFVTGTTTSFGSGGADFWLIKTDAEGNTIWSHAYGGPGEDDLYWGQQTFDGGFILAGQWHPTVNGNFDFWLLKTDANGDSLWSRSFGGQADAGATYVVQTADSGFIVVGVTRPSGGGSADYWLVKTDIDGNALWNHKYRTASEDVPWCVRQTSDGGYVIVGSTGYGSPMDAWVVKTSATGDSLWSRTYGDSAHNESAVSVLTTDDGGFVIVGGTGIVNSNDSNIWLFRTNISGDLLWSQTYGGPLTATGQDILRTADGGYVITGGTWYGSNLNDVVLLRTGPDPLSADDHSVRQPSSFILSCYPNPFNPSTTITFDLLKAGHVTLRVFDLLGREVAQLQDGVVEAGNHAVMFNGRGLVSGVYFARLDAGRFSQTKKLMLLK